MNVLFVMEPRNNAGCTQALANYARAGEATGHTMALYGSSDLDMPGMRLCADVRAFERVIYVFESELYRVDRLREVAMLGTIPRRHRYILDADAKYNPMHVVDGYDRNHLSEDQRAWWLEFYDALSDRVFQTTLAPVHDPRVTGLPFFGFDPGQVLAPTLAPPKQYDILYVGHNWWRWKEVSAELLPAFAQIRSQVGEIGFAGLWWDHVPEWAESKGLGLAFQVDTSELRRLRIRVEPPVPFTEVIRKMSTARVNIFSPRPILRHLKYLTQRYFEEFCADTIPLLMLEPDFAESVYGPAGRELVMLGCVAEKVLDALQRPDHYRAIVEDVRRHLLAHHSYHRRVEELVAALGD
jgi:hypothetical protein